MTADSVQAGWTSYDALESSSLSEELWQAIDFGAGPMVEPNATTTVQDGVLTVDVPQFSVANAEVQGLDNTKHLIISTRVFDLPEDGIGRFAVDLRSEIRDPSGDYRMGFATLTLVDRASGTVFNILSTGDRVYAEEEVLEGGDHPPFTRVIDDPFFFARLGKDPTGEFVACEIDIDRGDNRVTYRVDGEILHTVGGLTNLPRQVQIAYGIFTLYPVGHGISSAHGQGGRAAWRSFRYSV